MAVALQRRHAAGEDPFYAMDVVMAEFRPEAEALGLLAIEDAPRLDLDALD